MARIILWHLLRARYYVKTSICIISFNQINILLRKYYYYCYFTELGWFREVKEFAQGHAASEGKSLETFWPWRLSS